MMREMPLKPLVVAIRAALCVQRFLKWKPQ